MNYNYIFLFFLLIGGLVACQKPTEGCMHPRASNFSAEADKDVNCSYYQLQLSFSHALDNIGTVYQFATPQIDIDGDTFYIKDFKLMLSNIHLRKTDGTEAHIIDNISIPLLDGEKLTVSDNFYIAQNTENGTVSSDLGGWVTLDTFSTLNFTVGIADSRITGIDYDLMRPLTHPLSDTSESTYNNSVQQYYAGWANLGLNKTDSIVIGFYDTLAMQLPYPVIALDAQNIPINIRLNYSQLFKGVSFKNDDNNAIITKLQNNLRNAFTSF